MFVFIIILFIQRCYKANLVKQDSLQNDYNMEEIIRGGGEGGNCDC